ncbi:BglG family transcription antiterminator [Thalassobacillus pellis]|uniref:BglG family transcription antiterminator n=1 Tax=Thalassobacillus pellis TaxID=748008 RepID=UPI0019616D2E|nr:BglG family transcription antiterminator [Thalassobacillus pellis]MBM7552241.1 mannitol operon transcriptional antiterminator [Thalassobacillus pellis]
MYMTGRERKLLEILLDASQEVSVKNLSEELDVSTRTIHRDMKNVEDILNSYDIQLDKKAGSGFVIAGTDAAMTELRAAIHEQASLDYTPEERHVLLLSRLLEAREPVKLVALANELGVTVATLSNDLDKMEVELSDFHLSLVRKRGYGVEVRGDEAAIREAINHLIMEHMDELDFLTLLREKVNDPAQSPIDEVSSQLLGMVDKEKLKQIEKHLEELRDKLPYHLADSAYIGLLVHLALALERVRLGEMIDMDQSHLENMKTTKEYAFASELIDKLANAFEFDIPEAEIGYTTMHLMGAKARFHKDYTIEESSISVAFKAKQLIEIVSNDIGSDLHRSPRLLNDLVVHLKPSVYRLQQNMGIQNPLTEQIYEDYPELFQVVKKALDDIFPELTFPIEETAFVVMHFASALLNMEDPKSLHVLVVCSSGIGTAKMLAARLKREFKDIETVEHHSLFDLEQLDLQTYDMIISTVHLRNMEEYIQVNPILPPGDIHRIEHAIRKVRISGRIKKQEQQPEKIVEADDTLQAIRNSVETIQRYATSVNQVLDGLLVENIEADDLSDALRKACAQLSQTITSPDEVVKQLAAREQLGGLGIPETKLALYHTKSEHIEKVSFTIHYLKRPLVITGMDQEDMKMDTMLLMLAPEGLHQEGLEVMSFISSLIVEEEKCIAILQSKDEERIIHYLSNQLHQFFKNKR